MRVFIVGRFSIGSQGSIVEKLGSTATVVKTVDDSVDLVFRGASVSDANKQLQAARALDIDIKDEADLVNLINNNSAGQDLDSKGSSKRKRADAAAAAQPLQKQKVHNLDEVDEHVASSLRERSSVHMSINGMCYWSQCCLEGGNV